MDAWIRFMAEVNPMTASALMRAIDSRLASGTTHLHLLLSSPGGSVFHGLSIHNYLKGINAKVSTYNFGSADSIGVVIFCAGSDRYCVPNARFHIHGVKLNFKGPATFDEKGLEELLKLMRTDYTNVARVIAATTGKTEAKILNDMNNQTSLMPEEAKKYGLVNKKIQSHLVPAGAGMIVIYEDASMIEIQPPPQQQPLVLPTPGAPPNPQPVTGANYVFVTSTPMGFTGRYSGE
jgi:ATP-dependent Clp endopeptidase proteolytic subunit ClpP